VCVCRPSPHVPSPWRFFDLAPVGDDRFRSGSVREAPPSPKQPVNGAYLRVGVWPASACRGPRTGILSLRTWGSVTDTAVGDRVATALCILMASATASADHPTDLGLPPLRGLPHCASSRTRSKRPHKRGSSRPQVLLPLIFPRAGVCHAAAPTPTPAARLPHVRGSLAFWQMRMHDAGMSSHPEEVSISPRSAVIVSNIPARRWNMPHNAPAWLADGCSTSLPRLRWGSAVLPALPRGHRLVLPRMLGLSGEAFEYFRYLKEVFYTRGRPLRWRRGRCPHYLPPDVWVYP
jgi:hypothetical protein